jgi:hypothetical protein
MQRGSDFNHYLMTNQYNDFMNRYKLLDQFKGGQGGGMGLNDPNIFIGLNSNK